jgi:N-acetylglutamate synthase-like GNAT family acetyltransferase
MTIDTGPRANPIIQRYHDTIRLDFFMNINFRRAKEIDQAAIKTVVRQAKLYPFELNWQQFYVALDNKSIIGVGQIKKHRDGSRELASIAVVPEFQGQGVATALIHKLLSPYDDQLYLLCRDDLESFYQGFGFITVTRANLPPELARRQWMGNFFTRIVSLFARRPMRILAMRRRAAEQSNHSSSLSREST